MKHFYAYLLVVMLAVSGCATASIMDQFNTGVSDPLAKNKISDLGVFRWAEAVKAGWGQRSINAEAFDVGGALTLAALSTAVLATSTAANTSAVRGLAAAGNFVLAAIGIIKPVARDNAFNTGGGLVSTAEGAYLKGLTQSGYDHVPTDTLTPQGAQLYDSVNAAITVVGNLMVGLLPKPEDVSKAANDSPLVAVPSR